MGANAKVSMVALKTVFEDVGATKVATYIQSGNVVFDGASSLNAKRLETAIEKRVQLKVAVTVRTRAQLRSLIDDNPYDESAAHVGFLFDKPKHADVARIDAAAYAPEGFTLHGADLYLHLPFGVGGSKGFMPHLTKRIGVPMTVRNWRTVTTLLELVDG